jgi:hypothetical protein
MPTSRNGTVSSEALRSVPLADPLSPQVDNNHEDEMLEWPRRKKIQRMVPSLSQIVLLLIGGFVGSFLSINLSSKPHGLASNAHRIDSCAGAPSSPASDVVHSHPFIHQAHQHEGPSNPYRGAPKEESNLAWKTLLQGYNLRVPVDDLPSDQPPSVLLADGSNDAWVSLSVYHHLHCLDSLRHQIGAQDCPSYDTSFDENGFSKHFGMCCAEQSRYSFLPANELPCVQTTASMPCDSGSCASPI